MGDIPNNIATPCEHSVISNRPLMMRPLLLLLNSICLHWDSYLFIFFFSFFGAGVGEGAEGEGERESFFIFKDFIYS